MRAQGSKASLIEVGIGGLSARFGLSTSPTRRAIPPPIFLRPENRSARSGGDEESTRRLLEARASSLGSALAPPAPIENASLKLLQNAGGLLTRGLNWIRARQSARSNDRRLQVAATVSLGDKRFVAVIQVDGLQFLVGGGATNVALLAQLNGRESFGALLKESMTVSLKQIGDPTPEQAREQG
jgi:hypothetical protein